MQKKKKTFKYPNATVRVHRPDLTDEEREKRMTEIKRSAEAVLREVIKNNEVPILENCKKCIFYDLWYDEQRQEDDDKIIIGQEREIEKHFCHMWEKGIPQDIWNNKTKCQHNHKL